MQLILNYHAKRKLGNLLETLSNEIKEKYSFNTVLISRFFNKKWRKEDKGIGVVSYHASPMK